MNCDKVLNILLVHAFTFYQALLPEFINCLHSLPVHPLNSLLVGHFNYDISILSFIHFSFSLFFDVALQFGYLLPFSANLALNVIAVSFTAFELIDRFSDFCLHLVPRPNSHLLTTVYGN